MSKKNPLLDFDFLKKLDLQKNRTIFTKIILMNFKEENVEEIQGRTTGGSVSVDGSSAVRRTCSITLVANELNIHTYYWGLHSKIKIFIGVKNEVDDNYDDIIWFPMGVFLITSFNTTQGVNNYTISISGKDKMCLLNGDIGGNITSLTYDFGTYDTVSDDGTITNESYLLQDIILETVHEFCQEPYHNIIIKDLDDLGVELIEYRGKNPIYFQYNESADEFINIIINGSITTDDGIMLDNLEDKYFYNPTNLTGSLNGEPITIGGKAFRISKYVTGDVVGYRTTDLTYAGDLIGNVGESLTSACLDKIKTMLGDFEYFYNLNGQFVFQRRPSYTYTSWNPITKNEDETYVDNAAYTSAITYSFEDAQLISSFQNTPNLANVKNDYSIWGARSSVSGDSDIPIHLRYAIDEKPCLYKNYDGTIFYTDKIQESDLNENDIKFQCDWREIIYQMACDYQQYNHDDDFISNIRINNLEKYPTGYTGYEQYYTDIYSFWRDLYWPTWAGKKYKVHYCSYTKFETEKNNLYFYKQCTEEDAYSSDKSYYYLNIYNGYIKKYSLDEQSYLEHPNYYYILESAQNSEYSSSITYYQEDTETFSQDTYWLNTIETEPEMLNFWFDFLDGDSDISAFSVKNIGIRSKAENEDSVKAIYFRETPTVILVNNNDEEDKEKAIKSGYSFIQIPDYLNSGFTMSSQGKSAMDELNTLLYNYAYCAETISITCLPVYYLQPNTRIFVYDKNSGINGEYIIDKINYLLTYNGTMTISATKVVERLY